MHGKRRFAIAARYIDELDRLLDEFAPHFPEVPVNLERAFPADVDGMVGKLGKILKHAVLGDVRQDGLNALRHIDLPHVPHELDVLFRHRPRSSSAASPWLSTIQMWRSDHPLLVARLLELPPWIRPDLLERVAPPPDRDPGDDLADDPICCERGDVRGPDADRDDLDHVGAQEVQARGQLTARWQQLGG